MQRLVSHTSFLPSLSLVIQTDRKEESERGVPGEGPSTTNIGLLCVLINILIFFAEFLPIFNVQMPRELVIVLHYFDGTTEQLLPPATVDFDGLANQGKAVDAAAIIVNHNQCFRSSNIGLVQFMTAGRANGAALTF